MRPQEKKKFLSIIFNVFPSQFNNECNDYGAILLYSLPLKAKNGVVVGVGFWLISAIVGATEGFWTGIGSTSFRWIILTDTS